VKGLETLLISRENKATIIAEQHLAALFVAVMVIRSCERMFFDPTAEVTFEVVEDVTFILWTLCKFPQDDVPPPIAPPPLRLAMVWYGNRCRVRLKEPVKNLDPDHLRHDT
jgi:hypothetical protein